MAKILTFRNRDGAPSDQGFLTDQNQTLSFRETEDGRVSLGNLSQTGLPTLFPDPKKDWSNQELADLFRVRQLLSSANVPVETDRGVTDEGDPWFVFCHAGGEVFIHLCRIDGLYLLDSPNVLRPLRGADFNDLIADFTNQALPAQSPDDDGTERRVIKLERGGKVRLHPSAMLAALIWTLFLASEELVLLAPEEQAADHDALLDFDGMFAVETPENTDMDFIFEDDMVDVGSLLKADDPDAEHPVPAPDAQGHMREAMQQQQGLTVQNNAFTMGLSTIAIAMGFMSETVLLDNQRKVLESLKELGFSEYGADAQRVAELDIPADEEGSTLLAMLADFLGLDLSLNTDLAEAQTEEIDASQLQQDLAYLMEQGSAADLAAVSAKATKLVEVHKKDLDGDAQIEPTVAPSEAVAVVEEDAMTPEMAQDASLLTLSQIMQAWQLTMEEFQLGQTTVRASFNVSDTDAFFLFDWIDNSTTAPQQRLTSFQEFDDTAQSLIDFIDAKDGDLGIIVLANEIIMVDRTAVTGGEIEYMHWETAEGMIITLVGLQSDFQQFDMIA